MDVQFPQVRVVRQQGGMTLEIDGRPQPFTTYKITESVDTKSMLDAARAEIPALTQAGVTLCWVPVFIGWEGPGVYDFTDLDLRVQTVLDLYDRHTPAGAAPAHVAIRLQAACFSPAWYVEQQRTRGGAPTHAIEWRNSWATVSACPPGAASRLRTATAYPDGSAYGVSLGDPFWETHAVDMLTAVVRHVQAAPYAHRVFGWLPCALNTNEWFLRTFTPGATCDFSAPTQRAFRAWLRRHGSDAPARPVPSPEACQAAGHGEFLDPAQPEAGRVEEFSRWMNRRIGDIILAFARTIKGLYSERPPLVGTFYGYTTELSRFQNLSQSGHLDLARVLASPDIDFLCSPCQYFYRHDEAPFSYSQVLGPFSCAGADLGKLAYLEDDHPPVYTRSAAPDFTTRDAWHDEMFFRRTLAQVASHGQQLWWYSLGAGWLKEPQRQAVVARMHQVGLEAQRRDRTSVAQVAVVIDERAVAPMRLNAAFQQALILDSVAACFPAGAPIACHELSLFLRHADPRRYRFVYFPNLGWMDDETRAALARWQGGGRTLMFAYAPGYAQGGPAERCFSADAASAVAGMRLAAMRETCPLTVWVDPARTALLPDGADLRYGWLNAEIAAKPLLCVDDPAAEALGYLTTGAVGLARRRHADWTAVFSAAPLAPSALLRALFRDAGVHLYAEGNDVVYANAGMVALSASAAGERTLRLPRPARLTDALSGETLACDAHHTVTLPMKRHETRIFWTD